MTCRVSSSGLSPTQVKALPVLSELAPDFTQTEMRGAVCHTQEETAFFPPPFAVTVHGFFIFFPAQKRAAAPCDAERANAFAAT